MPPIDSEYKPAVGLRDIYYALVTQDDASAYAAGTPAYLAPAMTAKLDPAVNTETLFADDGPYENMTAEGETTIEIEVTEIPLAVLAVITGCVYDAVTGSFMDNMATPPYVALGFRAKKSNGSYKYYWYYKGRFTKPSEEKQSDSDTPNPKPAKVKFTGIKTIFKWTMGSVVEGVKRRIVDSDVPGTTVLANWFTTVQVPTNGSPAALTMTPVPADNASGISVSANQTLTFSNPMNGNVLNGIALIKGSDDSPVAASITINAARTVVTIDPTSNLTAATEYYISVVNATDIYGQVLANTVVSFTTA
jgi:phi13 family phage major tail protein